jgi:hypothetical protein
MIVTGKSNDSDIALILRQHPKTFGGFSNWNVVSRCLAGCAAQSRAR